MDPIALRRLKASKLEEARAIGTCEEGLDDEKRSAFDTLMSEVERLDADILRA